MLAAPQADAVVARGYSAQYAGCMDSGDAARGITVAIMSCLGEEIDRQDAALNRRYRLALLARSDAGRRRLRASERAWIHARDRRCRDAAARESGGSLAGILHNQCILDETIRRTRWLERLR